MDAKKSEQPIAITAGEPAGIGPELCIEIAYTNWADRTVIITDPDVLLSRAKKIKKDISIKEFNPLVPQNNKLPKRSLLVWPQKFTKPIKCGKPNPENSEIILDGLRLAIKNCQNQTFKALVTGPIQKSSINDAGIPFSGHTEFIAKITKTKTPVMLMVSDNLRVALASTHIPLSEVSSYINSTRLTEIIEVLIKDLRNRFFIENPNILVCGLNPHAGENGYIGHEDNNIIRPVIKKFQRKGIYIKGPLPADTAFIKEINDSDAILAMYHDQGLPVIKYASFGKLVNVTLGLPIIRTSVDHGTALDIAGTGKANPESMLLAIELAAKMAS